MSQGAGWILGSVALAGVAVGAAVVAARENDRSGASARPRMNPASKGLDYWDEDPSHPLSDWKYEVSNGDTLQGYYESIGADFDLGRKQTEEGRHARKKLGLDYWDEDPSHPLSDWKYEVSNGDTLQGYYAWIEGQE